MAYSPYPESKFRGWHVVVFLGVVVIVADIVSLQMLGTKNEQFQFSRVPAPAPQPPAAAPPKTETVSLSAGISSLVGSSIVPGSRVDVRASIHTAEGRRVFTVAQNLLVLTATVDLPDVDKVLPTVVHVSLEVTEKQARALALVKERGCRVGLKPRYPESKATPVDLDEVIKFLEEVKPVPEPEVAPPPRPKGER